MRTRASVLRVRASTGRMPDPVRVASAVGAACCMTLLHACMVPPAALPGAGADSPADARPAGTHAAVVRQVHELVNAARAQQGAGPLLLDDALDGAALRHAQELAVRGVLSHSSVTPGQRTMAERIEAAGASWIRAAENLVRVRAASDSAAALAVELWLSSEGHRRNMLEPVYTRTGIGIARDDAGQWFMVQLFTRPRETS